jgi:hypothetical protein
VRRTCGGLGEDSRWVKPDPAGAVVERCERDHEIAIVLDPFRFASGEQVDEVVEEQVRGPCT